MTKAEVITKIIKLVGCDKQVIVEVIPQLLSIIAIEVAEGNSVFINDFGTFHPKLRNETTGRDITRNKLVNVPAHYIPQFRPYRHFMGQVRTANL